MANGILEIPLHHGLLEQMGMKNEVADDGMLVNPYGGAEIHHPCLKKGECYEGWIVIQRISKEDLDAYRIFTGKSLWEFSKTF